MRIVADENIPFAEMALRTFGEVRLLPGRSIARSDLLDADALVVRSVTKVGHTLLEGTPVRFVGTATIGTDHIDLDYLHSSGIRFADAAGSNANSVAEYVSAALLELRSRGLAALDGESIGIIGVGHVGSLVAGKALALGMRVVEYDPPRSRREKEFISAPLSETLACDIITLHLPLTSEGEDATEGMVDSIFLDRLRQGTILFNTSRGGVVSSDALIAALRSGRLGTAVLDVWEGEPAVPRDLVELCAIATPHIAGYSFDGKVRGTVMMADALARFLGRESDWRMESVLPENAGTIPLSPGLEGLDGVHAAVRSACDIVMDDRAIRDLLPLADEERRSGFDRLRRSYRQRREFPAYAVSASDPVTENVLQKLGFRSARLAIDAGLR